jgi:hypothetical protein
MNLKRPQPKKRKQPESQLQRAVYRFIRMKFPGVLCFHCPNGGKRSPVEAAIFKAMGVLPGVADLLVFWRGGHGAIELKAGKGSQTDSQRYFQVQWIHCGGQYAVCRSIDEVEAVLNLWGAR